MRQVSLNEIKKRTTCSYMFVQCSYTIDRLLAGLGKTETDDVKNISIRDILEINGLGDALSCATKVWPEHNTSWRKLAVQYARTVQHLVTDINFHDGINVADRYAAGMATDEELKAAYDASEAALSDAVKSVPYSGGCPVDDRAKRYATLAAWSVTSRVLNVMRVANNVTDAILASEANLAEKARMLARWNALENAKWNSCRIPFCKAVKSALEIAEDTAEPIYLDASIEDTEKAEKAAYYKIKAQQKEMLLDMIKEIDGECKQIATLVSHCGSTDVRGRRARESFATNPQITNSPSRPNNGPGIKPIKQ